MRLPSKDSATWRAIMTGLQTYVGFLITVLLMPEFRELVLRYYPAALPGLVFGASLASLILNFLRTSVKNY